MIILSTNWVFLDFQTAFGAAVTGQSADVSINNVTFNRSSSSGFAFGFNVNFSFTASSITNLRFDSCQFNDTNATISDPAIAAFFGSSVMAGFHMAGGTNVTLHNCEANGTSLTLNTPMTPAFPPVDEDLVNIVNGFALNLCNNVKITNCASSGLKFQNNSGVGVRNVTESFALGGVRQRLYISESRIWQH